MNEIKPNPRLIETLDEIFEVLAYDAEEPIKKCTLEDGREVILIQTNSFTISRIYVSGRPDGKRPYDKESYFEYFTEELEEHKKAHGSDEGFQLLIEDWQRLFQESADRYMRYLLFSGINRWADVKRDTDTNLAVADFAKTYAPSDIAWEIYQYKGYILMMNTIAKAELSLMKGNHHDALVRLDTGINLIGKYCGECLKEGHEDAENVTRERYLDNLIQYRRDIEEIDRRLRV